MVLLVSQSDTNARSAQKFWFPQLVTQVQLISAPLVQRSTRCQASRKSCNGSSSVDEKKNCASRRRLLAVMLKSNGVRNTGHVLWN